MIGNGLSRDGLEIDIDRVIRAGGSNVTLVPNLGDKAVIGLDVDIDGSHLDQLQSETELDPT